MTVTETPRRRRRGPVLLVVTLLLVAAVYALSANDPGDAAGTTATTTNQPQGSPAEDPAAVDAAVDRAVDAAADGGTVTVSLTEGETAGLVANALERAPQQVNDVTVDLVDPPDDAGADVRMVVDGRLDQPALPVRAVVDLEVVDARVVGVVNDLRVGPLPVTGAVRDDVNRQLRELSVVADDAFDVDAIATDGDELVVRGRRN